MKASAITLRAVVWAVAGLILLNVPISQAQQSPGPQQSHEETFIVQEYYTIDETQAHFLLAPNGTSVDLSPISLVKIREMAAVVRSVALNLLNWTLHPEPPILPPEKYNRQIHFGRWINDPTDDTCYNTRAKVLIRDSEGPVSFKEKNRCLVERGDWSDPYAGHLITESKDIQIDHMVPLKNAYVTGAWEWDYQTRCIYANYLGNSFHLITANGRENMRKGDRAPDAYLPPNESYRCQYLENWLKIKLIWSLKLTPSEVSAIRQSIEASGCNLNDFSMSQRELKHQRKLIHENNDLCPAR